MAIKNGPFERIFPTENGGFQSLSSPEGIYLFDLSFDLKRQVLEVLFLPEKISRISAMPGGQPSTQPTCSEKNKVCASQNRNHVYNYTMFFVVGVGQTCKTKNM